MAEGLYAVVRSGTTTTRGIYKIDPDLGTATLISSLAEWTSAWKPMVRPGSSACYVNRFDTQLIIRDLDDGTAIGVISASVGTQLGGGEWHEDILYLTDIGNNGRILSYDPNTVTFNVVIDNLYDLDVDFWPGDDLCIYNGRFYTSCRFFGSSDNYMWSANLDGTDMRSELVDLTTSGALGIIAPGDGYLYGANPHRDDVERWAIDPVTGELGPTETWYTFGGSTVINPTSVATDGVDGFIGTNNTFIVSKFETFSSPSTHNTVWNSVDGEVQYVIWIEPAVTVIPPLRHRQRDDQLQAPRMRQKLNTKSVQGSLRRGKRNRYL